MYSIPVDGPGIGPWLTEQLNNWGIDKLTEIQSLALDEGIANGQSMIVSAPTSTGKTLVGEIAILAALKKGVRCIYLVSHKALADQKYEDFVSRFGEKAKNPIASVGLNTGDRAEGDINSQLMIATYEKALGLIIAGQLKPKDALIVADELQILGDPNRGPDIETLCAVLKQRSRNRFVALTASVENSEDLASWMGCKKVESSRRDVPLLQEIWYRGKIISTTFGEEDVQEVDYGIKPANSVLDVVTQLLDLGRGPVLVFTETRREASDEASSFSHGRQRESDGIFLAEQLNLFSEPTESSDKLRENAERRVAFHSADLSPEERQVIEQGLHDSKFEACFATSTLAAGVNYPFRSVVFPKLTFQWRDPNESRLSRVDYRNMSGRAGRFGMHNNGYAVLLPNNNVEFSHAQMLVKPENDRLSSKLVNFSLRKTIIMLIASGIASCLDELFDFFRTTFYWYQKLNRNQDLFTNLQKRSTEAIQWLMQSRLLKDEGGNLLITQLGSATAISGLLPSTAVDLAQLLRDHKDEFEQSFEDWSEILIYSVCKSDEFMGERPSRFLPWPRSSQNSFDSVLYWQEKKIPVDLYTENSRLAQCARAIVLYIEGLEERKIFYKTNVSSGYIHRFSNDVSWVLDGVHKLATVHELACPQTLGNKIALLSRRVKWGVPAEALDIIRMAKRYHVPGLGRQRAMTLIDKGICSPNDILSTSKHKLSEILQNEERAYALLEVASDMAGHGPNRCAATHERVARDLGIGMLLESCNEDIGIDYEKAIIKLLRKESSWNVTVLDDGKRKNVPDFLLEMGNVQLIVECKTCKKPSSLINKEKAWAVVQKAADFNNNMRRVTLGKPEFDETSKIKACSAPDITLVEHGVFIEGLLRVLAGSLPPKEFLKWLAEPGVADFDRLGGKPTHLI